jgi:hypothetical protein
MRIASTGTLAGLVAAFIATAAAAHHGWSWAEDQQTEIRGTVRSVEISPPHPVLQVETAEGQTWRVELGNPNQTSRAGFIEGSARPGNQAVVRGHRSSDPGEKRIKAVRITVEGKAYDIYPERIRQD